MSRNKIVAGWTRIWIVISGLWLALWAVLAMANTA